ncbi:fluoride efflux transporter CrcB [Novosphingobium taihuense]|uniref:Fluoride-specific ion channel FluC n=1 Tax=Novosphingobium taihuense TaxID=260085 RepID=A0A7W7ESD0_9SPHN|nr:fluoride efflux transporter CrcB [Novosphingobium taihuense]MBB4612077.1 CrcB protein [Novosphingobium taihuense]TWH88570.1 camphor resistance protein CrcB [Novosphingobium taihuense]
MNSPNTLTATAIVAIGGGVGAMLRYHAGRAVTAFAGPNTVFPWGTFLINVSGSLLMGLLAGWLARQDGAESLRLLLGVGVLGGFTTFSAFSLETAMLMQRGLYGMAGFYALGSLLGGVAGLFLGLSMMRGAA